MCKSKKSESGKKTCTVARFIKYTIFFGIIGVAIFLWVKSQQNHDDLFDDFEDLDGLDDLPDPQDIAAKAKEAANEAANKISDNLD